LINCNLAVRGCEGMRKGSALDPLRNFLEKVSKNFKNFRKKGIFHQFSPTKW